jgi:hypothetical protein
MKIDLRASRPELNYLNNGTNQTIKKVYILYVEGRKAKKKNEMELYWSMPAKAKVMKFE